MVIDTSALPAVLQDEPERHTFNEIIGTASSCCMSTASFVELSRWAMPSLFDFATDMTTI